MTANVDAFFQRQTQWADVLVALRGILLDCGLGEELKWGKPCYAVEQGNIAILQPFKDYCALMFFKGVLLKDSKGLLVAPGENSQSSRQLRFTSAAQVARLASVVKAYTQEAVAVEQAGLKVTLKTIDEYAVPDEFQQVLNTKPAVKKAFAALTPGRQRQYLMFFGAAKQAATRRARVEKCLPHILAGKGMND